MNAEQITTAMLACYQAAERAAKHKLEVAAMAQDYPDRKDQFLDYAAFWQHEEQRYREAHAALMNLPHSN